MEISCTNDGCSELIARYNMDAHFYECDFEVIPCRYAALGCEVEVFRKDLEKHEHDREQHIDFAIDAVPTLWDIKHWELPNLQEQVTEQHDSLQDDIARLDSSVSSLRAKQQEAMKQQNSVLAHMKTTILAQSKEISELKLKLEIKYLFQIHMVTGPGVVYKHQK